MMSKTHLVQVRRPKVIVFDILGTASKSGFLEKILFPYLKMNLDNYINSNWHNPEFMHIYKQIVTQSNEFKLQEASTPVVKPHDDADAKISLMNFINFVNENSINAPSVTRLRFKVWFEGYQQSKIRTPIYSDVPDRMKKWFSEGVKFNVFSNTWIEAQKALLRNTNHGDLTNLISGYYDNEFGSLTEPDSWRRLCAQLKEAPRDVLFLTKAPIEGRAAGEAGVGVVLVLTHRHNVRAVSREDRIRFPYVRTLHELAWLEETQPALASPSIGTKNSFQTATTATSISPTPMVSNSVSVAPGPTSSVATNTGQSTAASRASSSTRQRSTSRSSRATGASSTGASSTAAPSSSGPSNSVSGAPSSSSTKHTSTTGNSATKQP